LDQRALIAEFFKKNPNASIDACARMLGDAKIRAPFSRPLISGIRRQVHQDVKTAPSVIPSKEPVKRVFPILTPMPPAAPPVVEPKAEAVEAKPPAVEVVAPPPAAAPPKKYLTKYPPPDLFDRKKAFLNTLVDKNPAITTRAAQDAIKAEFGTSMDSQYLCETLRIAKELNGIKTRGGSRKKKKAPVASKPIPVPTEEESILVSWGSNNFQILRASQVKKYILRMISDITYEDLKTIKIWKEVPSSITFDVNF